MNLPVCESHMNKGKQTARECTLAIHVLGVLCFEDLTKAESDMIWDHIPCFVLFLFFIFLKLFLSSK